MAWSWALFATAAVLLVVAGAPRALQPESTVRAARELGLPVRSLALARGLGLAEAALGIGALLLGGPVLAGGVAVVYLGFAAVTWRGLQRGAASCGCFVGDDAPPTALHVAVDLVLAAGALAAALAGAPGLRDVLGDSGVAAVPLLAAVALDAGLGYLLLTRMPVPVRT